MLKQERETSCRSIKYKGDRHVTGRNRQVLNLLLSGETNYQISCALGISVQAVKYNVRQLFDAFDVSSRMMLVAKIRNEELAGYE